MTSEELFSGWLTEDIPPPGDGIIITHLDCGEVNRFYRNDLEGMYESSFMFLVLNHKCKGNSFIKNIKRYYKENKSLFFLKIGSGAAIGGTVTILMITLLGRVDSIILLATCFICLLIGLM